MLHLLQEVAVLRCGFASPGSPATEFVLFFGRLAADANFPHIQHFWLLSLLLLAVLLLLLLLLLL